MIFKKFKILLYNDYIVHWCKNYCLSYYIDFWKKKKMKQQSGKDLLTFQP